MSAWLFIPGHDEHKLRKAYALGPDVVIVDWEDGVPTSRLGEARALTARVLSETQTPCRTMVRVNAPATRERTEDLSFLTTLRVDGILLPKIEREVQLEEPGRLGLPLVPTIETARGLEGVAAIARSTVRIERIAFGSLDFLTDFGLRWRADSELVTHARVRISMLSRASGLAGPVDGVYPLVDDLNGLHDDVVRAREIGFEAKLAVHPAQVQVIRGAMSLSSEEKDLARRVLEAFAVATEAGRAATTLDGEMIDAPTVEWARRVLGSSDSSR